MVVLICISLIISDIEHFFHVPFGHQYVIFEEIYMTQNLVSKNVSIFTIPMASFTDKELASVILSIHDGLFFFF